MGLQPAVLSHDKWWYKDILSHPHPVSATDKRLSDIHFLLAFKDKILLKSLNCFSLQWPLSRYNCSREIEQERQNMLLAALGSHYCMAAGNAIIVGNISTHCHLHMFQCYKIKCCFSAPPQHDNKRKHRRQGGLQMLAKWWILTFISLFR